MRHVIVELGKGGTINRVVTDIGDDVEVAIIMRSIERGHLKLVPFTAAISAEYDVEWVREKWREMYGDPDTHTEPTPTEG